MQQVAINASHLWPASLDSLLGSPNNALVIPCQTPSQGTNGNSALRPSVMADLSLDGVLQQAPRVFEFLRQGRGLNVLQATNTGLRDLVQQYVTHITIPDQSHMLTYAHNQWPNLQRMSLQCLQDPSAVAGLLRGGQISWLEPTFAKLDLDAITALRTGTWPWQMLTNLAVYYIQGMPVDALNI